MSLLDRVRLAAPVESRPWRAVLLLAVASFAVTAVVLLRPEPELAVSEQTAPPAAGAWSAGSEGPTPAPAGLAGQSGAGGAVVVVEVIGSVRRPGVVRLPTGARVIDAIAAAGGLTGAAGVNLARPVVDGEQIVVGAAADVSDRAAGSGGVPTAGLLDLNSADAAALEELPGIGPVLAERIVRWRTDNGGFRAVAQLQEVPGIGPAIYSELAPRVRVG